MKRLTNLFVVVTLGAGALAGSCGGGDARQAGSGSGGSAARAGASGRSTGGSATVAGRGGTGRGGESGMPADGGTGGTLGNAGNPPGAGGKAGAAGKTSAGGRGGTGGRAGRGGRGGTSGAGTGNLAGAGGEAGGRQCIMASPVQWFYTPLPGYEHVIGTYGANLDASGIARQDAVVTLSLFLPDTGPYTLGIEEDSNLKTCKRCLQAKIWNLDGADHQFFAEAGELDIAQSSDPLNGVLQASLQGARLTEVTVDPETALSTPVLDGYCIDLADDTIDVDVNAPGTGGEGGGGGTSGAGNEGGAAGGPEVPTGCLEIGVTPWDELIETGDPPDTIYYSYVSPNLGSAARDLVALEAYSDQVGSFALGHGIDSTIIRCDRCLLVNVPDQTVYGRYFFAVGGTLDIAASSQPTVGVMDATVTDVTFAELGYDYMPLPGGDCLHLGSSSIVFP